jgi:hypothetical protein
MRERNSAECAALDREIQERTFTQPLEHFNDRDRRLIAADEAERSASARSRRR